MKGNFKITSHPEYLCSYSYRIIFELQVFVTQAKIKKKSAWKWEVWSFVLQCLYNSGALEKNIIDDSFEWNLNEICNIQKRHETIGLKRVAIPWIPAVPGCPQLLNFEFTTGRSGLFSPQEFSQTLYRSEVCSQLGTIPPERCDKNNGWNEQLNKTKLIWIQKPIQHEYSQYDFVMWIIFQTYLWPFNTLIRVRCRMYSACAYNVANIHTNHDFYAESALVGKVFDS